MMADRPRATSRATQDSKGSESRERRGRHRRPSRHQKSEGEGSVASSLREEMVSVASPPRKEMGIFPQVAGPLRLEEQESSRPDPGDPDGVSTQPSQHALPLPRTCRTSSGVSFRRMSGTRCPTAHATASGFPADWGNEAGGPHEGCSEAPSPARDGDLTQPGGGTRS
eukprot:jgi/Undpi1/3803/HiC_scaffold_16.g07172.m1